MRSLDPSLCTYTRPRRSRRLSLTAVQNGASQRSNSLSYSTDLASAVMVRFGDTMPEATMRTRANELTCREDVPRWR